MTAPTAPIYGAAPVVIVDGERDPRLDAQVQAVLVEETTDGLARCELTVGNWGNGNGVGHLWFDREVLDLGVELRVEVGSGDRAGEVFAGRVSAIESRFPSDAAPQVVVLAEDGLQALRMSRRTRTFEDVTDEDVIRTICEDHGLSAEVDAAGPTHRTVAQVNTSDLALLRERARLLDADIRLDDGTVVVRDRSRRGGAVVTMRHGRALRELTVTADLANQFTNVVVSGWDPRAKQAVRGEADRSAVAGELEGGTSGPETLAATLGARTERLAHLGPTTGTAAEALATHAMRASARRFLTGTAVVEADARIRAGTRMALAGVGPLHNGRYDVVAVRHHVDEVRGALSTVELERPGLGGVA